MILELFTQKEMMNRKTCKGDFFSLAFVLRLQCVIFAQILIL